MEAACTFLFVGGTIWRKGVDLLIAAWSQAFGPDDDVALVIKDFGTSTWYDGQTAGESIRDYAARGETAPVVYIDDDLPARDVASLYRAAEVLVVPYRGEGFCLPALEAMACGLPVIHTGTGPTNEFVPTEAGWALAAREMDVPSHFDIGNLAGPARVQEVDVASLVSALREAAFEPDERLARARCALTASAQHTWAEVAARARASLKVLADEALPLARLGQPQAVERRPGWTLALYAPNWRDDARWTRTLRLWADAFTEQDEVTLALHCGEEDPDELAERIMQCVNQLELSPTSLPDLMLCRPDIQLQDLVCAADVVLVDDIDINRPELVRRALRVVPAGQRSPQSLRAQLGSRVSRPSLEPSRPTMGARQ